MRNEKEKQIIKKPGEFRIGKTKRDHQSGSWTQRIKNLTARGESARGKERSR